MPEQLSLPGLDDAALPFKPDVIPRRGGQLMGYSLFLAIVPEPAIARRLARVASDLRRRHQLGGKLLTADRLHVTLIAIDGFVDTIPRSVVDAAVAASAGVICPSIPIVFDHVLSYAESNAFVLRCTPAGDAAIARLRQSLAVLSHVGLGHHQWIAQWPLDTCPGSSA